MSDRISMGVILTRAHAAAKNALRDEHLETFGTLKGSARVVIHQSEYLARFCKDSQRQRDFRAAATYGSRQPGTKNWSWDCPGDHATTQVRVHIVAAMAFMEVLHGYSIDAKMEVVLE